MRPRESPGKLRNTDPQSPSPPDWQLPALLAVVLILTTVASYARVFSQDLVTLWDDGKYINPTVLSGLNTQSIRWAFTTTEQGNYHPLTWMSLMLDAQLFGGKPVGFKFTNLFLHVANALLVYFLFRSMTRTEWSSFFIAAIFALHPLHVESVAWASERKDTLSTFFALLALVSYVRYARTKSLVPYVGMLVAFGLSLLSKQMYVTLPFLMLLLDYWPMERLLLFRRAITPFPPVSLSTALIEKAMPLALAIGASAVIYSLQGTSLAIQRLEFTPASRAGNAIYAYAMYLQQTFLPINLSFFYPYPPGGHSWQAVAISTAIVGLITLAAVALWRRLPYLFVGWFWYLGTLVPVVGFVQVGFQAHADRYTYFPMLGLLIILIWPLAKLAEAQPRERVVLGAMGLVVVAVCAALTWLQVGVWANSPTLARHGMSVTTRNDQAHTILGYDAFAHCRWPEAKEHLEKAVEYNSGNDTNTLNLATVLLVMGQVEEARKMFQSILTRLPGQADATYQLGLMALAEDRYDQAIELLKLSHERQPSDLTILAMAIAHVRKGDVSTAQKLLEPLAKDNQEVRLAAELVAQMKGGIPAAKERFETIFDWPITVQASRLKAERVLAMVELKQLSPADAVRELRQALDLWSLNTDAMLKLAIVHARSKQMKEAEKWVREVLRIDPKNIHARQMLGLDKKATANETGRRS